MIKVYIIRKEHDSMKKYLSMIIIVLLQALVYFLAPQLFKVFNVTHVIVGMLIATFGLSMIIIVASDSKLRFLYSIPAVALFVLSIPLYYNSKAYDTVICHFFVSVIGVLLGFLIDKFIDVVYNRKKY